MSFDNGNRHPVRIIYKKQIVTTTAITRLTIIKMMIIKMIIIIK
jgi:hypothetical protein